MLNLEESCIKLYTEEKFSISRISKELNIGYKKVKGILKKANIEINSKLKSCKYAPELFQKCKDLYTIEKLNRHEISNILNLPVEVIEYLLSRSKTKRVKRSTVKVNLDKAVELHNKGLTIAQVAQTLNVDTKTLKRRGLTKLIDSYAFYKNNSIPKDYDFFKSIDTEAKAYFLGFILADGSIVNSNLSITLQEQDRLIVETFRDLVSPQSKIVIDERERTYKGYSFKNRMVRVDISSKDITNDLIKLGIEQNKTYKSQSIPKAIPKNLLHHFIRGIFDGDGSVWVVTKTKRISVNFTGEYNLLSEIKEILLELGLSKKVKLIKKPHQHDSCIVYSALSDVKLFFDWIYKDALIYLPRKYNKFIEGFDLKQC